MRLMQQNETDFQIYLHLKHMYLETGSAGHDHK